MKAYALQYLILKCSDDERKCPDCGGSGEIKDDECPMCGGAGCIPK